MRSKRTPSGATIPNAKPAEPPPPPGAVPIPPTLQNVLDEIRALEERLGFRIVAQVVTRATEDGATVLVEARWAVAPATKRRG